MHYIFSNYTSQQLNVSDSRAISGNISFQNGAGRVDYKTGLDIEVARLNVNLLVSKKILFMKKSGNGNVSGDVLFTPTSKFINRCLSNYTELKEYTVDDKNNIALLLQELNDQWSKQSVPNKHKSNLEDICNIYSNLNVVDNNNINELNIDNIATKTIKLIKRVFNLNNIETKLLLNIIANRHNASYCSNFKNTKLYDTYKLLVVKLCCVEFNPNGVREKYISTLSNGSNNNCTDLIALLYDLNHLVGKTGASSEKLAKEISDPNNIGAFLIESLAYTGNELLSK